MKLMDFCLFIKHDFNLFIFFIILYLLVIGIGWLLENCVINL